jgi:hypothetical protein
VKKEEIS